MHRSLLRPKWIAFHLTIAALVVLMVSLGFWQLRRLDQRQERNSAVRERSALAAEPIGDWLDPSSTADDVAAAEWRPLSARGSYDPAATVLIRNRSLDGVPGYHVVTPIVMEDGSAVLVNRGFIPRGSSTSTPPPPPAPSGTVEVVGRVRPTQARGVFGLSDPEEGTLTEAHRIDVARLTEQLRYPVIPAYLELQATTPQPAGPQPALLPLPELDEGPHLSYAIQWFLFSAMAIAGWFLAVRRSSSAARARDRRLPDQHEQPAPEEPATPRP